MGFHPKMTDETSLPSLASSTFLPTDFNTGASSHAVSPRQAVQHGAVHPAAVHAGRENASGEACPACQGKHVIVMIIDDDGRRFKFRRCRRTALTLDVRGWWFQQSEGAS